MTSRADRPKGEDGASPVGQDQARSIPDGGLGSAMPAWLRRPPAWKRTVAVPAARTIPPPDTSIIDPGAILEIDDLPQWLQAIARRGESRDAHGVGERSVDIETDRARDVSALSEEAPGAYMSSPTSFMRDPVDVRTSLPQEGANATRPWWMSDSAIGGLFVAVILTLLYVILSASGVI